MIAGSAIDIGDPDFEQSLQTPVIGILAQRYYGKYESYGNGRYSYVAASYKKWLESAGARVTFIRLDRSEYYYRDLLSQINGVLFPGGAQILDKSEYGLVGRIIFKYAREANATGDYFPLFGICLGCEMMVWLSGGKLTSDKFFNVTCNTFFEKDFKTSRMFSNISDDEFEIMTTKKPFIHYHRKCIHSSNVPTEDIRILSLTPDTQYVDMIEYHAYPFYGVMFHPEKPAFEFIENPSFSNIPHDDDSIRANQYLANFFVSEARKSQHKWTYESLVGDLVAEFTGKDLAQKHSYVYFIPLEQETNKSLNSTELEIPQLVVIGNECLNKPES